MYNKETRFILECKQRFLFDLLTKMTNIEPMKVGDTDLILQEDLELRGLTDGTFDVLHESDWVMNRVDTAELNNAITSAYFAYMGGYKNDIFVTDLVKQLESIVNTWYTFAE
tara:strand:+ start:144 stop:479 length:336 start_codon:yes stop_codon:yes gene_type:complete